MPGTDPPRRLVVLWVIALLLAGPLVAQTHPPPGRMDPPFRFSPEAGQALRALWDSSLAAHAERVACLGAEVRNDSVFVHRILMLAPEGADSMGIASDESVERCGPPEWSGTVHSHVAEYSEGRPSATFSAQDRGVMRRWYERWHADGVFCVVYSKRDAHCEADGVVGGMRVRPRVAR
jgi:hypothetical protein